MKRTYTVFVVAATMLACGPRQGATGSPGGQPKEQHDVEMSGEVPGAIDEPGQVAELVVASPPPATDTAGQAAPEAKLTIDDVTVRMVKTKYSTMVYCYVRNDGNAMGSASLGATFKDASGKVVGTAAGYVNGIVPGRKKPVQLFSSDKVDESASVNVEIEAVTSYGVEGEDDIYADNVSVEMSNGYPKVKGAAINKGTKTHSFVLYAVFSDASGSILGLAISGVIINVEAGASATFDCISITKLDAWDSVQVGVAEMME